MPCSKGDIEKKGGFFQKAKVYVFWQNLKILLAIGTSEVGWEKGKQGKRGIVPWGEGFEVVFHLPIGSKSLSLRISSTAFRKPEKPSARAFPSI